MREIPLQIQDDIELSIIIPCYNESHRILSTLQEAFDYLDKQDFGYEILVMDDASTDDCGSLMKERFGHRKEFHLHRFERNRGKGYSIKVGMERSRGRYLMFMDADLAVPLDQIPRLLFSLRNGSDVVVGIRIFDNGQTSRLRRIIGYSLLLYVNILLPLPPVPDTQCGFKGFTRRAAGELFSRMRIHRGMFDVEIIFLAGLLGLKITSLAVPWKEKAGSTIRLGRCLLFDPFDLLRIAFNNFFGRYR